MRVRIDTESDALYIDLTDHKIDSSEEVSDGIIVDYDKDGNTVGVEILDASKKSGEMDVLKNFNLELPKTA